jgi:hypothetical protein
MQCMAGAMTAGAAVTGARAYVAARRPSWLSPPMLKRLTACLLVAGVVGAGFAAGDQPGTDDQRSAPPVSSAER